MQGQTSRPNWTTAAPFTAANDGTLGSIDLAIFTPVSGGATELFHLDLTTDDTGLPSATILESFSFSVTIGYEQIISLQSLLMPDLIAGTPYWLVASGPENSSYSLGWYLSNIGATGVYQYQDSNFTDVGWVDREGTAPTYRLNSAVVPEPSTFLLLGGGLIGLAFAVRRRKE